MESEIKQTSSWLDRPLTSLLPRFNIETLLIILILVAAVLSRFYDLGLRVMSHDEVNHVVPSFDLYQGRGYKHDPVTHGPMQFHLIALTYFLMGDNDFSSRVPSAVFGVITVAVVIFTMRRYLGRTGALIAGVLFLISPYILFYSRYARNESFVTLWGVLTIYFTLRYLEKGEKLILFLITAVTALDFCTKETAFIYTAQLLLFLGIIFLKKMLDANWFEKINRQRFTLLTILALLMLGVALGFSVWDAKAGQAAASAENTTIQAANTIPAQIQTIGLAVSLGLMLISAGVAFYILVRGMGWQFIRSERTFDLLILIGTMILPQLTPIPVKLAGWNPIDYTTEGMIKIVGFLVLLVAISTAIGLWWKGRFWLYCAALFYGIFTVLYTTFFTNGQGFFTGIVGSLGYWMAQQGVERGSQPLYYYALLQIPVYEFLAALGTFLALYFGIKYAKFETIPGIDPALQHDILPEETPSTEETAETPRMETDNAGSPEITPKPSKLPVLAFLVFWSITALIAYSIAGEKMPWLTVHITLPLLLCAGWGLGYLVDSTPWKKLINVKGLLVILLMPVFLTSLGGTLTTLMGNQPPFQGNTLDQLQATSTFVLAMITTLLSGWGILKLLQEWEGKNILRLVTITFYTLMAVLTARVAFMANYINYDNATEYLVYAHAASGPKEILAQVEEISRRTTRGLAIDVAYDDDALYPYWWYLRNYPNHNWYGKNPSRDLREASLVIAGDSSMNKVDSLLKDTHYAFTYTRLWWPNQDYFNLTWGRIWGVIKSRDMRQAIFNIWLNRDYSLYAKLTNSSTMTLENWQPSAAIKLYIRKDIIASIWNYGSTPTLPTAEETDPYLKGMLQLKPDMVIGTSGTENAQLQNPHGIAISKDGFIYIADTNNNRIQKFDQNGKFVTTWGRFADASREAAPGGTFNQPWGIAIGPDGFVYVADTWNHRIQKFTADGQFVTLWNTVPSQNPEVMWGPRGIAIDNDSRVYVTDTGNKRVLIFSSEGEFISQFGGEGFDPGQLDEPVGIAVDDQNNLYLADTWNQRVQVMAPDINGTTFYPVSQWDVKGWDGKSVENKPFITVSKAGVLITDPEGYRVLMFSPQGIFILGWGDYSANTDGFGLPSGIAVDEQGYVWVTDAENNRILRFTLPPVNQ